MAYPNVSYWAALKTGPSEINDYKLSVIDCGRLRVPSGQLVVCDPFVFMDNTDNPSVAIPPGDYSVKITLADVSEASDGSHLREAYATVLIDEAAN